MPSVSKQVAGVHEHTPFKLCETVRNHSYLKLMHDQIIHVMGMHQEVAELLG